MKIDLFRDGGLVGTLNPSACIEASATVGMDYASATIELHHGASFLNADYFGFNDPTCPGNYLLFFVERIEIKDTTVIRGQHAYHWDENRSIPPYNHIDKENFDRYFKENYGKIGWRPTQEFPEEDYHGNRGSDLPIISFLELMRYLRELYRGLPYIRISAQTRQQTISFTKTGYTSSNEGGDWYFEDGVRGVRIYRTLEYEARPHRPIITGAFAAIQKTPYNRDRHPAPRQGDPPVDWDWVEWKRFPPDVRGGHYYDVAYPHNIKEILNDEDFAYGYSDWGSGKCYPYCAMFTTKEPIERIRLGDYGWQGYLKDVYLDLKQFVAEHDHPRETFTIEAPVCYGAAPGRAVTIMVKGESYKHMVKEVTFDLTAPWRQTIVTERAVEDKFRYQTLDSGLMLDEPDDNTSYIPTSSPGFVLDLRRIINPEGAEKL